MAVAKRAATVETAPIAYEADVSAWAREQADHLRAGAWSKLDVARLVDEVEAVGRTERHVLRSALRPFLLHLLRWDHQPAERTRSWSASIRTQRLVAAEQLEDNPSLSRERDELMAQAYRRARIEAAAEPKLAEGRLPETHPYDFDASMNRSVAWPPVGAKLI